MHIFIKNKKFVIGDYKVKCSIGKRGIGLKKKEGDLVTPRGKFRIKYILYRNDRISKFKSKIKKITIKKNMGWCDDPNSINYNKLIKFPFTYSAEKLYKRNNTYDLIIVLNFNMNPIIKNKGSAIFIHIAKQNFQKTAGCVAISKKHMKKVITLVDKNTIVNIN